MPYDYNKIREGRRLHARPKLLANALHKACRRQRLSAVGLAQRAGVPLLSTQLALAGGSERTSFWTLARLAQALKLDLNYLAGLAPAQKGRSYGAYTSLE